MLEVANTGPPIPEHLQTTLFDPFRQVGEAKGGPHSGLGLGLYIVRELVRAHLGDVTVLSTPEAGTVFTVRIPATPRGRSIG